jgi:hypothetical protein
VRASVLVLLLLTGCTSTGSASLGPATLDERDTTRLTVTALHGSCDRLRAPEVQEDARQVRVTIPLTIDRGDCNDLGVQDEVPLVLARPLGVRRLVDDSTGRTIPVVGRDRCRLLEAPQLHEYVGLTEAEARTRAQADGYEAVRVLCADGRVQDSTRDRPRDRVSLTLEDGRVTSAVSG